MMAITIATISAFIMVLRKKRKGFLKRFRRSKPELHMSYGDKGVEMSPITKGFVPADGIPISICVDKECEYCYPRGNNK